MGCALLLCVVEYSHLKVKIFLNVFQAICRVLGSLIHKLVSLEPMAIQMGMWL